jgi:glutamate synthase domain-containing protein 2
MSLGSISQETHEALAQVRARALFKLSEPSSY